jgi:hypothetical protein
MNELTIREAVKLLKATEAPLKTTWVPLTLPPGLTVYCFNLKGETTTVLVKE